MSFKRLTILAGGVLLALGGCAVTPPPTAVVRQTCKQFTQPITIDGKQQTGYGVQCQQPDGSWLTVTPPGPTPPPLPPATVAVPYAYPYPYPVDPYSYNGYPWMIGPSFGWGFGWYGGGWGHGGWDHGGWDHGGWDHGGWGHGGGFGGTWRR